MDTVTVGDFLREPDVLGNYEALTDEELGLFSDLVPTVSPDMALRDLIEIVQLATDVEKGPL